MKRKQMSDNDIRLKTRPEKDQKEMPMTSMKPTTILLCSVLLLGYLSVCAGMLSAQPIEQLPGEAREHYYQGVFYGKQAKYVEAILELERAIELYPAYADAYNALGVIYHRQNQPQKAIEQYLLAVEAAPTHAKARTNLALLYHDRQEYRKALHQLEKALESDPAYGPAQDLLAKVRKKAEEADEQERQELERQQRAAERASQTQTAAATAPTPTPTPAPLSFFDAGTQLIKEGQIEAGIREYRKGLERHPRSAQGHTLLAMAYRKQYLLTRDPQFRYQEITALNEAIKFDPAYVPALLALGEISYEEGAVTTAISYFQQVLQYQPDHPAKDQLEAIIAEEQ
ncbi:tetratricopeptide repeat protein [candidate division KSB3 bacterium]|uniref:Tetratricopeptide repeat protein n=1 Tax=candidate division KSB3 bacterium TaxID=2044937 RepID=A0A9D5JWG7_9BACT|nr:tetratricopeptide repeat protein [candidate division KSB3 bacterium]MBD3325508.1 tetratricopeptide repeat protein [candidate division KSB3 bacterium]